MISVIGLSVQVRVENLFDGRPAHQAGCFDGVARDGVEQQWPQFRPQPVMRGDVEALLLALEDRSGQLVAHQFP